MNNQVNATSQTVASALTTAENYLQLFANHTNFLQKMVVAFGNNFNPQNALGLQSDWLVRDLSFIPPIEIRESAEINGANGAFAGDKNRIYLSQEFLTANGGNVEVVATVLLEEIGHAVDWKLNSVDGLGDEGAIFAHLVRGDVLSQEYLEELRVEDDSATVWLDGELVEIEQATSYTVVDLGTLGGSESKAWAINNQGQVVGDAETSSGEVRAFIFTDENDNGEVDAEEIQDIRGSESKARDINDRGQVVGFLPPTSSPKAFVWDEENGMETLSGASRSAFGINNDGDIVGYFKVPPFNFHSIRWENGEAIPLNTPLPNNSWATSINDNDQIVGYTDVFGGVFHAFLWNEGTINAALDLGSLDGASNTQAWSINNRGEVVGQSGKKAFLWDSSKGIQDLGSLTTGSSASRAFGINNLTQVVGESDNKAFLWEDTNNNQQSDPNEVVDLNELIPDDSDWTLEVARDINDAGEIVGSGSLNGETHAFLLIPEKQQKSADLSVRKSDSADPVKLGETLTYTIEVTNNGPGNATDVTLTEQLPETVTFESASLEPEVRLREDSFLQFDLGSLDSGESKTVTIDVIPTEVGTIINEASVSGAGDAVDDPNPDNDVVEISTEVIAEADLSVTKSDSADPINVGETLTYTIEVTNNGPGNATDVTLTEQLPETVTFESASLEPEVRLREDSFLQFDLGSLDSGESKTVTIDVIPTEVGTIINEASVSGAGDAVDDPNPDNDVVEISTEVIGGVDLSVTKSDSADPVKVGETLTYTLEVKNNAPEDAATEAVLTDVLPKDVDFVSATVSQGTFTEKDGTVTFKLGTIEAEKEVTAEIVVKPTEPTVPKGEKPPKNWEIINNATVAAFQTDTNESNNTAKETTKVQKDCSDTTPIRLEVKDGEFADSDNDGKCEASGTIYIGRTDGIERMLRVENATAEHDDKNLTISGIVYSEIGGVSAPLFQGSFTMPFNKATTTLLKETNKLTEEYKIAGTDIDFQQLTLEPEKILFGSKFQLPKDVGGSIVEITGKDALLIDKERVTFGQGGKISLSRVPKFSFFGMFDAELFNLSLEYVAPEDKLKLKGKAILDSFTKTPFTKITADFSGDDFKGENYIEIKDGKADFKGSLAVEGDLKIGKKGWGLSEVKLEIDTKKKDIAGSAKLDLPFARIPKAEFEMGFKLPISLWELNKVSGSVDGLNLWVPKTPIFFQKFGLGLENFAASDPDPIEGTVTTAATFGPQVSIKKFLEKAPSEEESIKEFFDFVGIDGDVSLARLELEGKINSEQVEGKSLVTIFHEKIGKVQGKATLNWDKQFLKTSGNISLLDGFIKSNRELQITSDLSINTGGAASVNVPDFIPFINNKTLASGNFSLKFSNDNDFSNDFIAGWGTLLDQAVVGFKVYFDGEVDWLGAQDVATVGKNFRIKKGQDLLLMNADWDEENPQRRSSQNDVPIEVKTPDGKWIKESEFAANNIEIVDNLGDTSQKTVLVSNPQAGNWNIRVAQKGLGKVEYSALQNTSGAPTLELKPAVVNEKKSKVTFDYKAFDANSKAEISFFYDTDNKDFNGTLIKDGVVEKDKKGRFVWNTTDVPEGKYYIYGIIEDENNVPVMSYSPVQITVGNPLPDGKTEVGNGKKNKLKGTGKDDLLDGKGGNDILIGNKGEDTLIGGGGKDTLNGGKGDDIYQLNAKTAKGSQVMDSEGNDFLELEGANISLEGLAKRKTGVERKGKNLIIDLNQDGKTNAKQDLTIKNFFANKKANKPGKGFIETVDNLTGEEIIDSLTNPNQGITKNGNQLNNTLRGSELDDVLNGKGGNDKLFGNNGNDILTGGNGNDKLNGGEGEDILTGGNGKDSFIFDDFNKTETDEITDFILGEDKLILDKSAFKVIKSSKGKGFSRQREFAVVDDAADVASSRAFIVYNENSGELFYNANGNKAGLGIGGAFAKLDGAPNISATDFRIQL